MNKTDVTTGRIVQRVIDATNNADVNVSVSVKHGIDEEHDLPRLMDNLYAFFPNSTISFKRLKFGYELKIEVEK